MHDPTSIHLATHDEIRMESIACVREQLDRPCDALMHQMVALAESALAHDPRLANLRQLAQLYAVENARADARLRAMRDEIVSLIDLADHHYALERNNKAAPAVTRAA